MPLRGRSVLLLAPMLLGVAGCLSVPPVGGDDVAAALARRTGATFKPDVPSGRLYFPDTVNARDGVSADEAAQLALCNNAAFQELLTDLGAAHGDLVQAGLLANPEVFYSVPVDPKPLKYAVDLPVEVLALRPHRVKSATAEWERVKERLTQAGLDVVRDARVAHAAWGLAADRLAVANENRALRVRVAELTESRLKAGDATPLELSTANIDRLRAEQDAVRAVQDVRVAEERFRNVLGLGGWRVEIKPEATEAVAEAPADLEALVAEAITHRPDVRAAEHAATAAAARIDLAGLGWLRALVTLDATSGPTGHNPSPAVRLGLPIFNRNQGASSGPRPNTTGPSARARRSVIGSSWKSVRPTPS
jgi:outer membrane protein, heavy metal efflux system